MDIHIVNIKNVMHTKHILAAALLFTWTSVWTSAPTQAAAQERQEQQEPNTSTSQIATSKTETAQANPMALTGRLAGPPGPSTRVTTGAYHLFETDVDGGGQIGVTRLNARLDTRLILPDNWFIEIGAGYELDDYTFDETATATGLAGLDPWDTIHNTAARVLVNKGINREWSVFAGPFISLSGESGALDEDALTYGAQGGARYVVNDQFSIGFGATVSSQIEDSVQVSPILFFNWDINSNWLLRSGYFDLGSDGGPGLELAWKPNDQWELALGTVYESRRFRLDDDGSAPDGVGETDAFSLALRARWQATSQTQLSLVAGSLLYGELTLDDRDGHEIASDEFDPTPFVGLRLRYQF